MKAAIYKKYGPPSVLTIETVEKPLIKNNEVLIKVYAATVNRSDCAMLRAKPFIMRFMTGLFKPKNPILGTDFAGKIEAIGKDVTTLKVGDNVFGFNDKGVSSHAQYMKFTEGKAITTMPEHITYEQAAASLEGAHYAYNIIKAVKLKSKQKVLVNGATGAIGSAAVQLLKNLGVHVTAVCNTKNIELMKSIGAHATIDYTKEDFTKSTEKYCFVLDAVGKSTFAKCKPILEEGGIYISSELGPGGQNLILPLITSFSSKKLKFPLPMNCLRSILFIKKLIEEGKFKAVIDRKYPMEEIAEAYTYVLKGEKTGNVVIMMQENSAN
jgi:NADPH:quinone reductase-like Zn-dependent oxidoreductase